MNYDLVTGQPDWLKVKYNEKKGVISLRGDNSWIGQPVINRVKVTLKGPFDTVKIDRAMLAQLTVRNKGVDRPKVVLGSQAGTISKRFDSIIDFGKDHKKGVFVFKNTVPGKPFNHAQRINIRNVKDSDKFILANIGQRFSGERMRNLNGVFPGVSPFAIEIASFI